LFKVLIPARSVLSTEQVALERELFMAKSRVAVDDFLSGGVAAEERPTGKQSKSESRSSRLPSLTGMRFVAALCVFAYHAALPIPALRLFADDNVSYGLYDKVSQAGGLGVGFFFVLSGFILTWSARPGDTAKSFWRRRIVKIYPNYVVAWIFAMVLFAAAYTPAWRAIGNLFMLQVWIPDFDTNFSVDPPGWSLGAEAVFYACFPLLLAFATRIRPERLKYWIGGVAALVVLKPLVAYLLFPDTPAVPGENTVSVSQYWFGYILPPVRVLDFALGILVARAVMTGRWRNIGMVASGALLVGGYWLAESTPYLYGQSAIFVIPAALLIASAAIADSDGRRTIFSNRFMTWLGEISFAFYLMHFIVLAYGRSLLGTRLFSTGATIGLLLAGVVISVLVAWALYALVERPITRRWSTSGRSRRESLH
jgi:peptidoglycan/LPS O-acetylase OafA/YrhL